MMCSIWNVDKNVTLKCCWLANEVLLRFEYQERKKKALKLREEKNNNEINIFFCYKLNIKNVNVSLPDRSIKKNDICVAVFVEMWMLSRTMNKQGCAWKIIRPSLNLMLHSIFRWANSLCVFFLEIPNDDGL